MYKIKNQRSKYFPVKLADGRMSTKKLKFSSYSIDNIVSLEKMTGKIETVSWRQVEYEYEVKYLENLAFEKICCSLNVK